MSAQVVLPVGALVALISGTPTGDACLRLLGADVSDVARKAAHDLDAAAPNAHEGATDVVVSCRAVVAESERCIALTSETGDLRAAWLFMAVDQAAALALSPAGLHLAALTLPETRSLIDNWAAAGASGALRVSLIGPEGVRESLIVDERPFR